jgi:tRNA uridine 5-carboxymethylaminomethyl modification enzyme
MGSMKERYDVIVIGGGHAGTEAAWAAASVLAKERGRGARATGGTFGGRVALITMDPSRIGQMSCNPAIGGLGKGQIVREIDALGGIMGRAIDATGIMFKMLNTSKGAAVRGPRAQADKYAYAAEVQRLIATRDNIDVIAGTVDDIIVEDGRIVGVVVPAGAGVVKPDNQAIEWNAMNQGVARPIYPRTTLAASRTIAPMMLRAGSVVLTTGTFARGLMHTGEKKTQGGRFGEGAAVGISATLRNLGFELGRLKTGTPPRLARESIDWEALPIQHGDEEPVPFSDLTFTIIAEQASDFSRKRHDDRVTARFPRLPQIECRLTNTTAQIHEVIRINLHRAPMFSGQVEAECGPRYCPSIEDKIVRFENRDSHHVFLEPESLHTNEVYCNGISTSLPMDVQERMVHLLPGCENAKILKWGYAVEYDMVWPHQIDATCMAKHVRGLFLSGQINCTTGYEEAGGQGVIAGVNAARVAMSQELVRIARDEGYLGVMMDDLVTKPPREPYRMFTSRAEYRLRLRADNSDERLTPLGRELGLVDDHRWNLFQQRMDQLDAIRGQFQKVYVDGKRLREIARRPTVTGSGIMQHLHLQNGNCPQFDARLVERVVTEAKYDGYIERQAAEIKRQRESDHQRLPDWIDYRAVKGLRSEAVETLAKFRPATMGQAARLPGVNPADLTIIAVAVRRGPPEPAAV